MRARNGFSIVEIVVAMAIMAILLTVTMVSLQSSQANARDSERLADIQQIKNGIERYYTDGNSTGVKGMYPTTAIAANLPTSGLLPDVKPVAFTYDFASTSPSFKVATGADGATGYTTATISSQVTIDTFVYEPLRYDTTNLDWELCGSGECLRYNIYYRTEANPTVVQVIKGDRN